MDMTILKTFRLLLLALGLLVLSPLHILGEQSAYAQAPLVCTGESDGNPYVWNVCVPGLIFDGASVTDNGDGTATIGLSAGSGDITDVFDCASGNCQSITMTAGDVLDTTNGTLELPQQASCNETTEGRICWDTDSDTLCVGSGAACTVIGSSTDTNAVKEYWWPASAALPLEAADAIPPINKDAGTNIDQLTVDFQDSADECRTVSFKVPSDVQSGSTITFRVHWYSAAATSGSAMWDFRHNSGVAEGVDPDQALTIELAASDATQGTAGQLTFTTWTETLANLAWASNDQVDAVFCRDGNGTGGTDDLVGDAKATGFGVEIPRS
jgi:hypothetical protein